MTDRVFEIDAPMGPPPAPGEGEWVPRSVVEAVLEMTAAVAGATRHQAVLRALLPPLHDLVGAEEAMLALDDRDGAGLRVLRIEIDSDREIEEWVPRDDENPIGWVARSGDALWRNHLASDVRFPIPDDAPGGSEVLLPVATGDSSRGVLGCRHRESFAFSTDGVELLVRMARIAGVAIEAVDRYRRLGQQAFRDALTGLLNRGSFDPLLEAEVERCQRFRLRTTLLLLDIDDFKTINDTHGHPQGDRVLGRMATLLRRLLRRSDQVARYGGEEFAVLLAQTPLLGGERVAEKIRSEVAAAAWKGSAAAGPERVTISIGVSEFPGAARSTADLVRSADQALYRAKRAGKNRVEGAPFLP